MASAFPDEFERTVKLILSAPQLGAVCRGNRRRYFPRKFPYGVVYQIAHDALRIIALAHQRRRPAYWRGRPSRQDNKSFRSCAVAARFWPLRINRRSLPLRSKTYVPAVWSIV